MTTIQTLRETSEAVAQTVQQHLKEKNIPFEQIAQLNARYALVQLPNQVLRLDYQIDQRSKAITLGEISYY